MRIMSPVYIREASVKDCALILSFVKELAKYEKAEHEVIATEKHIKDSIFSENATTQALICELEGKPIQGSKVLKGKHHGR